MSVKGVRSSWLILIKKRIFSSYIFFSCSRISRFSRFSFFLIKLKKTTPATRNAKKMHSIINQVDFHQGGETIIVKISIGWLHSPLEVSQDTLMVYSPDANVPNSSVWR